MAAAARRICGRCVLPHSPPDIWLNEEGICNVCVEHANLVEVIKPEPRRETDFTKLLTRHRGKGDYDCLVMCSGGKDSTSALYYMTRRYKLRPLAFTFDHGFETEEALGNVRRAVDKLGVDFLFYRSTYMHDMFARILRTGSRAVICHVCSIWYMDLTFKMAARLKIPMIIAGWTKGQSTDQQVMSKCGCNSHSPEFQSMAAATAEFLDSLDDPRYADFPRTMEEVLRRARKRHKSIVLSPHWFLPYDTATYVKTIQTELDWRFPELSYPAESTNCSLNFVAVHNSVQHFGYTHYHVEMSKMIRSGRMTRDEALGLLEIDFDTKLLNEIVRPLGHSFPPAD